MNAIATMTVRGQVTLPRKVRESLGSRILEFEVRDDGVMMRPVPSVAGGLAAYAGKPRPLSEVRAKVWKEAARAKAEGRPS